MTHKEEVLNHLKASRTLTLGDAIQPFNYYRLSAFIQCLRKSGYHITTHNESNTHGQGKYACYELRELTV